MVVSAVQEMAEAKTSCILATGADLPSDGTVRPTKLFIGGISRRTTTKQLRDHFSKCGKEPQLIDNRYVDLKPAVPDSTPAPEPALAACQRWGGLQESPPPLATVPPPCLRAQPAPGWRPSDAALDYETSPLAMLTRQAINPPAAHGLATGLLSRPVPPTESLRETVPAKVQLPPTVPPKVQKVLPTEGAENQPPATNRNPLREVTNTYGNIDLKQERSSLAPLPLKSIARGPRLPREESFFVLEDAATPPPAPPARRGGRSPSPAPSMGSLSESGGSSSGSLDAALGPVPTVGSARHATGECRRCNFFAKGRCRNGYDCSFCHFPHSRRKLSRQEKREAKLAQLLQQEGSSPEGCSSEPSSSVSEELACTVAPPRPPPGLAGVATLPPGLAPPGLLPPLQQQPEACPAVALWAPKNLVSPVATCPPKTCTVATQTEEAYPDPRCARRHRAGQP